MLGDDLSGPGARLVVVVADVADLDEKELLSVRLWIPVWREEIPGEEGFEKLVEKMTGTPFRHTRGGYHVASRRLPPRDPRIAFSVGKGRSCMDSVNAIWWSRRIFS